MAADLRVRRPLPEAAGDGLSEARSGGALVGVEEIVTGLNRKGEGAIVLAERLIEKLSSAVVTTTDDADAAG